MSERLHHRRLKLGAATCLAVFMNLALCTGNENFLEFRNATGPGLESGVQGLLTGEEGAFETLLSTVVSGLFEIYEPDTSTGRP